MPIHDYECPQCSARLYDHYLPLPTSKIPTCNICSGNILLQRLWTTNKGRSTFDAFDFTLDSGETVTIDSLAKLRRVEAESIKVYEKGEGRPLLFRHYSQDRSNRDQNIFRHLQPEQINPKKMKTVAGMGMEFGTFTTSPDFHPATERALAEQQQRRKR